MIQKEGSHPGFRLSVDNRPVDGGRPSILWQKRSMEIEGAMRRHIPHHLRKHAESHYHLHVGTKIAELLQERFVFQLLGLEHRKTLTHGILLDSTLGKLRLMTPHRLIGHCHHSHHIIPAFDKSAQRSHSKVGSAHKDDSKIGFLHKKHYIFLRSYGFFGKKALTLLR